MEDKLKSIKSIINEKLNDINFINNGNEKEKELINKLCTIVFPELKDKTGINTQNYTSREIILDEITINDVVFYKDKYGGLWNENAELVGSSSNNCHMLFDKVYNTDNNINNFL